MTELEPVHVPAASALVTDRLRRAIHRGTFAPGEQLPTERELAATLGVSRVTLREALRALVTNGYIVTRRGSHGGSTVTSGPQDNAELRRSLVERIHEFDAIMAFREIIEPAAARLAAARRDDEQLDLLRGSLHDLEAAESIADFRRADSAFHLAVAAAAKNPVLAESIADARERMFTPTDALPFRMLILGSHRAHGEVCEAIAERDGARAATAMTAHIRTAGVEFRAALGIHGGLALQADSTSTTACSVLVNPTRDEAHE